MGPNGYNVLNAPRYLCHKILDEIIIIIGGFYIPSNGSSYAAPSQRLGITY